MSRATKSRSVQVIPQYPRIFQSFQGHPAVLEDTLQHPRTSRSIQGDSAVSKVVLLHRQHASPHNPVIQVSVQVSDSQTFAKLYSRSLRFLTILCVCVPETFVINFKLFKIVNIMSQGRAPSPKFEVNVTEAEDDNLCPPPSGPVTRAASKKKIATPSNTTELDLSILLKFVKPYDGSRDTLNAFLVNCNNAYDLASDAQKDILFKFIICQLEGKAQTACSVKEFVDWDQLKEFLKAQFSETKHYTHLLTDLQDCKQRANEAVSQYALRVETCLSQLLTEMSISHGHKNREMIGRIAAMEELALHHFLIGLLPHISNMVRCKAPKTLNQAINFATSEEKIQHFMLKHNPPNTRPNNIPRPNNTKPFQNSNQPRFNNNNNRPSTYNNASSVPICRYCKTPGHTLEQCRKREYNNNRFKFNQNPTPSGSRVHFVSEIPEGEQPIEQIEDDDHYPKN